MLIAPADSPAAGTAAPPVRMILVDRQPLFVAALGRLLSTSRLGASVEGTTDAAAAMRSLSPEVDLLLAEVAPGVEDLVKAAAARGVPIMLLSDGDESSVAARALQAGAAGIFPKDSSPAELLNGIEAVLAGHRAIGSQLFKQLVDSVVSQPQVARPAAAELSPAETEILRMLAQGMRVKSIAERRGISQKTVRKHLSNVYRKLGVHTRAEAIRWAARTRLVPAE